MNWKKFLKIASIIEILLGLVIGGFGGFIFLLSISVVGPTAIIGLIFGLPMLLLGIFLIIFGVNLLKFKRWAWLASVITLIIVIAFFVAFKAYSQPIFISLCLGAVICLMLLILGRIKEREMSIPWKKIIIALLIIAGVAGYYLYRNLQRPVSPPLIPPEIGKPIIEDETADWEVYRNEEYGYEIKYPKDWKIVNVDWTVGREYVQFLSPLINNKYYFVLNFGARNKGDNTQISYQPDEDWELLKSLMRLGDKVKIGNVDVLTTEIVEKGKVHSILYSNRLGAGRIEISGLEIQANSSFIEGPQHLSASDVESIDLKNLPELKLANQILSTFKFIEIDETADLNWFCRRSVGQGEPIVSLP